MLLRPGIRPQLPALYSLANYSMSSGSQKARRSLGVDHESLNKGLRHVAPSDGYGKASNHRSESPGWR